MPLRILLVAAVFGRCAQGRSAHVRATPDPFAVLIEVDGAVVDVHQDLHRVAFNKAFEVWGVSWCTNMGT